MRDLWASCGFRFLRRDPEGRLIVTDDYLRWYYARPELAPAPESCTGERALHVALNDEPRRAVPEDEIAALADEDARENYRVILRFRDRLLGAPTLEAFYFDLFRSDVSVPPGFIHQTVQDILRNVLAGAENGLEARAAELFFRQQRVTVRDGAVMLADDATVEMHATGGSFGNLGRLILEAQAPLRSVEFDVLDEANHGAYFGRDERFDTVLQLNPGGAGSRAFARVIERWIAHFHGTRVKVTPIREIPDEEWRWHVGLDVEASAMLNEIYNGGEIEEARMRRIIGLYRTDFLDASALRAGMSGCPVFLGLAMTEDGALRMKPQNLLMNLPLARPA
jgi:hypothetical protein